MTQRNNPGRSAPVWLIVVGGVLLLAAAIIIALQMRANSAPTGGTGEEDFTFANIERVSLEEAKSAFDSGTAVFVDVRGPGAYEAGRIPGAVLLPVIELENRVRELDPNDWIITYCT